MHFEIIYLFEKNPRIVTGVLNEFNTGTDQIYNGIYLNESLSLSHNIIRKIRVFITEITNTTYEF